MLYLSIKEIKTSFQNLVVKVALKVNLEFFSRIVNLKTQKFAPQFDCQHSWSS